LDVANVIPKGSLETSWTTIEEKTKPRSVNLKKQDSQTEGKLSRFLEILSGPVADLDILRELCWYGIPSEVRALCWQLLLGCLPLELKKRSQFAAFKRSEYRHLVSTYYSELQNTKKGLELLQQVQVDCPRTMPKGSPAGVFRDEKVLKMLERILIVWSKEHPSIDYFQGLGDIAGEMLLVHLGSQIDLLDYHPNYLSQEISQLVESDTYWCLAKMLDAMEPYYKKGLFPGMQVMMDKLSYLTKLTETPLWEHMEQEKVEFVQFSLRWMLCLLTRELNASCVQRLWDSYFSEGADFSTFHIYVCAAFLTNYTHELKDADFSEMITFLQHLPTDVWDETDAQRLIDRACEIGDMEESLKDSYYLAIQATGFILTLLVLAWAVSN